MSKVQSFLRQPRVQETLSRANSLAEQAGRGTAGNHVKAEKEER